MKNSQRYVPSPEHILLAHGKLQQRRPLGHMKGQAEKCPAFSHPALHTAKRIAAADDTTIKPFFVVAISEKISAMEAALFFKQSAAIGHAGAAQAAWDKLGSLGCRQQRTRALVISQYRGLPLWANVPSLTHA